MEEQIALTVGTGLGSGTYFHAPGSAGATTGKLLKKGIPNVSMADGPAGLRLQQRTAVLKSGKLKAVDPYLSLMKYIPDDAYVCVLAILGKQLTSEELSEKINELGVRGTSHIVFVIGGSLGLAECINKRADYLLSFSKMTFPHQLMRVVLLEQIYRSYRIMMGEPYHK